MGRLPKGFKKAMEHHLPGHKDEGGEGVNEEHQHGTKHDEHKKAAASTSHQPVSSAPTLEDNGDGDEEGEENSGPETRGKMLQRHKREMLAFKKNLQRAGKKSKDEVAKLTAEIEARHAKELKECEEHEAVAAAAAGSSKAGAGSSAAAAATAAAAISQLEVEGEGQGSKEGGKGATKAMKRRAKLAAQEAEREARRAEELASLGPSAAAQEEEALSALLKPLKLRVRDIRADGHCMYRSVEDQLSQGGGPAPDHLELRRRVAAHIRAHPDEYVHYLDEDDADIEAYCKELEGSAAWGGQLELSALAQVLQRQIKVYAVGLPPVTLGEDLPGPALQVCYLRHAFGLGEHYNSTEPAEDEEAAA